MDIDWFHMLNASLKSYTSICKFATMVGMLESWFHKCTYIRGI